MSRFGENGRATAASDADLARAAQRGDKKAFVEIVARHQALVCGIALGILGDFAASEDAGQEAFLTAWRKIHELREPERLRAWLCQIARNAARGQLRARKPHCDLGEEAEFADEALRPDEAAASQEEAALVAQSLAKLPENYRLPLVLYYREGQSVRAVAEALSISEDAVKQRLARGREMCRDRISGLIENVLVRTSPTAIFTMTIAVAIGALAAPSVMAAGAFATGTAVGASASTSSSLKTFITSLMSTTKGFLIATALVTVVCIPIGYNMTIGPIAPITKASLAPIESHDVKPKGPPLYESSELFAEWNALHKQYGTNAQSMPDLYKAINALTNSFHRKALSAALITEWAQLDGPGGMNFFMAKGHKGDERRNFFKEWLANDPRAAVSGLMAAGTGWESIAHDSLTDIAHATPERVADIVAKLPKSENFWDNSVRDAFAIVAQGGLDAARQSAEAMTGPNREQALAGVAKTWAQSDLNAAIAWAKGLPDGTDKNEIIRAALLGEASVNPASALDSVGMVPSGGRDMYFASTTGARVLQEAAKSDFDGTVAWLTSHPGKISSGDLIGLAGEVTTKLNADPAGFLTAHAADGSLNVLVPALQSALLNGSSGNRGAVWDWLKLQPDGPEVNSLKDQVINSAGWQDPKFAMQLVADLPNTSQGNHEVQELAQALFNGGNMMARFDQLFPTAPDRLKTPMVESAFNYLRTDNLGDPQSWVSKLPLLPDVNQTQGTRTLASAWAGQSPDQAIAWANTLPQGEARYAAAAGIASGWAAKDPTGAGDWVSAMPSGPARTESEQAYITTVAGKSPQQAWNWALNLNDPAERESAAEMVVYNVAPSNPTTARQWIDSGPFTPDTKQKLMTTLPTTSPK